MAGHPDNLFGNETTDSKGSREEEDLLAEIAREMTGK